LVLAAVSAVALCGSRCRRLSVSVRKGCTRLCPQAEVVESEGLVIDGFWALLWFALVVLNVIHIASCLRRECQSRVQPELAVSRIMWHDTARSTASFVPFTVLVVCFRCNVSVTSTWSAWHVQGPPTVYRGPLGEEHERSWTVAPAVLGHVSDGFDLVIRTPALTAKANGHHGPVPVLELQFLTGSEWSAATAFHQSWSSQYVLTAERLVRQSGQIHDRIECESAVRLPWGPDDSVRSSQDVMVRLADVYTLYREHQLYTWHSVLADVSAIASASLVAFNFLFPIIGKRAFRYGSALSRSRQQYQALADDDVVEMHWPAAETEDV